MRHGKKFNHLGRKAPHRKAMLANMACSLIAHKRIKTTVAKAKALRVYIEPLLTKSKDDTTHSRRTVFSYLKQKDAITELFGDIALKISSRPGGYTRILKLNNRLGDNAEMCIIELVDYNEEYTTEKPKRKKTRRRGSSNTLNKDLNSNDNIELKDDLKAEVATEDPKVEVATEDLKAEVATEDPKAEVATEDLKAEDATEDTSEDSGDENNEEEDKKE